MKKIVAGLGVISFMLISQMSFAGAFFQVSRTGSTLTIRTITPDHFYPAAGIKINSQGHSFSTPADCTPISDGYCLFSVSDTTPKTISIAGSADPVSITLCLNGDGPLTCQKHTVVANTAITYAYMANSSVNSISVCSVDTDGSLQQNCTEQSDASFSKPTDIVLNHQANKAYVLNAGSPRGGSISICSLTANGLLSLPCTSVDPGVSFTDLLYGGLNPSNTFLYFTAYRDSLIGICTVNPDGSLQIPCNTSDAQGLINGPNGRMGFNPDGTHVYIPNYNDGTIVICTPLPDGAFTNCSSTTDPAFPNPVGASLNAAGTVLYVASSPGFPISTVAICPLNPDGSILTCSSSTGNGTFSFDAALANMFISTNFAYIPNVGDANSISICPILLDGTFDTCTLTTDSTFHQVASVWLS